jgi:hypothetical protein
MEHSSDLHRSCHHSAGSHTHHYGQQQPSAATSTAAAAAAAAGADVHDPGWDSDEGFGSLEVLPMHNLAAATVQMLNPNATARAPANATLSAATDSTGGGGQSGGGVTGIGTGSSDTSDQTGVAFTAPSTAPSFTFPTLAAGEHGLGDWLAEQQQQEQQQQHTHMFSVSAGVCPAIYWLGHYLEGRFDLEQAEGPYPLDLGDVVYAPNLMEDAQVGWGVGGLD